MATVLIPRVLRHRDAPPSYLGMDRNRFDAEDRPFLTEIMIGQRGITFNRLELAAGIPQRALKTAATEGTFQAEGMRLRKDGSRFWASVVIDPIFSADMRLLGFAKITRDVGDRKIAEEALRKSEQEFRLLVQGDGLRLREAVWRPCESIANLTMGRQ